MSAPPHDITLDKAAVLALVFETFNMGMFCILLIATLRTVFRKDAHQRNPLLIGTLLVIWVLSITHWLLDIARVFRGFFDTPAGPIAYYSDLADPLETSKTVVYITLILIGDLFMVYRCYIVWERTWYIMVAPVLMWIGTLISGIVSAILLGKVSNGIFTSTLKPWGTSLFTLSLATNLCCTLLIAGRILHSQRAVRRAGADLLSGRVYSSMMIFVESAALYSACMFILLVLYVFNSNAQYIALDITSSVVGITFSLIIIRLADQSRQAAAAAAGGSMPSGSRGRIGKNLQVSRIPAEGSSHSTYPLTTINVTKFVETRTDEDNKYGSAV